MRNFKLYLIDQNSKILLTSFDDQSKTSFSPASTYNEKLQEQENSQYTLTFSIAKFITPNELNQSAAKIHFGSKLILNIDNNNTQVELIVNSIQPTIYTKNIIYSVSAQDIISWSWSRINLGYSYSNSEEDENSNIIGVQNIYEIAEKVLRDCGLSSKWSVRVNTFDKLFSTKIILDVTDSNPYNVIIEACNSVNAVLDVDYTNHMIGFYRKDTIPFSGYRYRPETNLKSFSVSGSADNFITILHVAGGTNEFEELVTMVPAIPDLLSKKIAALSIDTFISNYSGANGIIQWAQVESDILSEGSPYKTFADLDNESKKEVLGKDDEGNPIIESSDAGKYIINTYNNSVEQLWTEEKEKLRIFTSVAEKVPHLGQFLYDFSYFEKTKQITSEQRAKIESLFNTNMLRYNLYLKLYEPQYYKLKWEIMSWESRFKTAAESYVVLQQQLSQATDSTNLSSISFQFDEVEKKLIALIKEDNYAYYRNLESLGYNHTMYIKNWLDGQDKIYAELYQTKKEELEKLKIKKKFSIGTEDIPTYDSIQLDEEITYIEQLLDTYKTLGGNYWKDANNNAIQTLYSYMLSVFEKTPVSTSINLTRLGVKNPDNAAETLSLEQLISYCEAKNAAIWKTLYTNYSQYIIEGKYNNSDEIDSISLFNQAITYYDNLNRPELTYSAAILDIAALEQIDVPRVKVGAKIKVYNEMLNYSDTEENLMDYRDNSLLITSITTTLRTPGSVSLTVSRQQWYKDIVEKLLKTIKY